jgi:hypothetical protein
VRYAIVGIISIVCTGCGSPSEKILGIWKTSFNCTSKQGVNVSYTGATSFSESSAEDQGLITVSSTDTQGKVTKIVARVESTSNWYIDNNQLIRKGYHSDFKIASVARNSENLYSEGVKYLSNINNSCYDINKVSNDYYYQTQCNDSAKKEKEKAEREKTEAGYVVRTQAQTELEQEAKKYTIQELEIVRLNELDMSLKQKNLEGLNNFNYASVCEQQDFKRLMKGELLSDIYIKFSNVKDRIYNVAQH